MVDCRKPDLTTDKWRRMLNIILGSSQVHVPNFFHPLYCSIDLATGADSYMAYWTLGQSLLFSRPVVSSGMSIPYISISNIFYLKKVSSCSAEVTFFTSLHHQADSAHDPWVSLVCWFLHYFVCSLWADQLLQMQKASLSR